MIFVSSKTSDGNMMSLEKRKKFFKKIGVNLKNVAEIKQIHGNHIVIVDKLSDPTTEADGLITNKKGVYLMIKIADCMAISFYDPKHSAIGLTHVGFRGLENKIIKKAVKMMKQKFDTNPKDLKVNISPSIGPCHYRMDIWKEAERQLTKFGVLKDNIHNPKICTYEDKEYFSHRRAADTNVEDFRFVTILGLKNVN